MKNILVPFLILLVLGCANNQMSVEDTIYGYYENVLQGKMENSEEFLEWDPKESGMIEYYADMGKLHKQYQIVSLEDFEIVSLNNIGSVEEAVVKMTYKDKDEIDRIEFNTVKLHLDSNKQWKIKSIIRKYQ